MPIIQQEAPGLAGGGRRRSSRSQFRDNTPQCLALYHSDMRFKSEPPRSERVMRIAAEDGAQAAVRRDDVDEEKFNAKKGDAANGYQAIGRKRVARRNAV